MSPHQNNCKANSCSCCRQNGCRKIPRASPVGAPHTNSANLRSARLKKGWRLCQPAPAPKPALRKQESWGRPFLHGGPAVGFSKEMKGCLVWGAWTQHLLSMTSSVLTFLPFHLSGATEEAEGDRWTAAFTRESQERRDKWPRSTRRHVTESTEDSETKLLQPKTGQPRCVQVSNAPNCFSQEEGRWNRHSVICALPGENTDNHQFVITSLRFYSYDPSQPWETGHGALNSLLMSPFPFQGPLPTPRCHLNVYFSSSTHEIVFLSEGKEQWLKFRGQSSIDLSGISWFRVFKISMRTSAFSGRARLE